MSTKHRAFLALGSNVGDRLGNIETACRSMERAGLKIKRTSSLWETKAMYVEDQDDFLNGACEVETELEPLPLLDKLQSIEKELGRVKLIDKGPRNIDLDILLYDEERVEHERLQIPHKLMLEREFVLRPLSQILPSDILPPPFPQGTSIPTLLTQLSHLPASMPMSPQTPLTLHQPSAPSLTLTPSTPTRHTHIMSILNLTPDSFSDGGIHFAEHTDSTALHDIVTSHIASGATIIDIGGQSTRPNAPQISAQAELARIMPALHVISSLPAETRAKLAVSVDTYRAAVAREAVRQGGADIINDVSAGMLDAEMLPTLAELGCSVVLMHMRGTPATMNRLTDYPDGLIPTVGRELAARVKAAEDAGIRRWRVILDPGIGFAKTQAHNLEILRRLEELREWEGLRGLPWLVGTSRKRFIGRITGVNSASDRGWGTAAAVTAAVQGGAEVVRVHDVDEMTKVVRVADSIWRVDEKGEPSEKEN
ncbi:Dihydropteroate synthase [Rhizodiscina lignyota]|uniref:Folic acid synthesis protein FOL1 n=1 Tax=Rhizodiscina lignyota TaxID=1504668 RepID=A0A9P4M657_9PEZI|nr:Dihydropteroate synthase [Rhizodiscina lignyota]